MSFIAKNPISAAEIDSAPPSPIIGTRGFFPKPDGWYDIDSEGNEKKVVTYNDLKNTPMVITDLGTYYTWQEPEYGYSSTSDKYDQYRTALDETKETGLYKFDEIAFRGEKDGDIMYHMSAILFVVSGENMDGNKTTTQILVYNIFENQYGSASNVTLPRIRHYYYDSEKKQMVWSQWSYDVFECSGDKTFGFENMASKVQDMSNNNIDYPSTSAVVKYVNSQISNLVGDAPDTLNTLGALAQAVRGEPNFGEEVLVRLGSKVDKETGKGLSSNDFTNEAKAKIDNLSGIQDLGTYYTWQEPEYGYSSTSDKYDQVQTALDETKETGVYKFDEIAFGGEKDGDIDYIRSSILLVTGGQNMHGSEAITQIRVYNVFEYAFGNSTVVTLPRIRHCYYDFANNEYVWSKWSYDVYEQSGDKSFGFENMSSKVQDMSNNNIDYPSTSAVVKYVKSQVQPTPVTSIPSKLKVNTPYNFGEVLNLNLTFPVSATDGDVVYLTFKSGEQATNLTIDTTNTSDIDIIPEANKGYEIFGKYNGEIWIVNYSEYTVSEG